MAIGFPMIDSFRVAASDRGVTLREHGAGTTVFLIPGMEGSGESCLHVALPAVEECAQLGLPRRLVLVDYAAEEHASFDDLVDTIHELAARVAAGAPCIFWAQSFGTLLAVSCARLGGLVVDGFVLVSPFTDLGISRTYGTTLSLSVTPGWLYRRTIDPIARYAFGPVGDATAHPFFAALRAAPTAVVRRRSGWLRSRSFAGTFRRVTAPTKVCLGERDRLVDLAAQRSFFRALSSGGTNVQLDEIPGAGHVALPRDSVRSLTRSIVTWLTRAL